MVYNCDCGHRRCPGQVSRSTWFRHRLAAVLGKQSDVVESPVIEPLPVEEAAHQAADPVDHPGDEVHNTTKILTYPTKILFKQVY